MATVHVADSVPRGLRVSEFLKEVSIRYRILLKLLESNKHELESKSRILELWKNAIEKYQKGSWEWDYCNKKIALYQDVIQNLRAFHEVLQAAQREENPHFFAGEITRFLYVRIGEYRAVAKRIAEKPQAEKEVFPSDKQTIEILHARAHQLKLYVQLLENTA